MQVIIRRCVTTMNAENGHLPVGIENFVEIQSDEYYYVDKTHMIRELLLHRGKVNLFTRPRRFGKSLNMSILKYFIETGDSRDLFQGLAIAEEREICEKYMGQFPVILISLKGVNGTDYGTARSLMCSVVGNEAMRFQFLADAEKLTDREKELYKQIVRTDTEGRGSFAMPDAVLMGSLKTLSQLLEKHYGKKSHHSD